MAASLQLRSTDGVLFAFDAAWIPKCEKLRELVEEGRFTGAPVHVDNTDSEALATICAWFQLHADEAPRTGEDRAIHKFNRNLSKVDLDLLDACVPRAKLAAVLNAAYDLKIVDMIDTMNKYIASNLEGKTAEEMSAWLEIPLKKTEVKEEQMEE